MKIFSEELVASTAQELHVADLSMATIGEVLLVAQYLERKTGIPFIRMDQGSPGLPVNQYGVEAAKAALDRGVGSQYPAAAGVPENASLTVTPKEHWWCVDIVWPAIQKKIKKLGW